MRYKAGENGFQTYFIKFIPIFHHQKRENIFFFFFCSKLIGSSITKQALFRNGKKNLRKKIKFTGIKRLLRAPSILVLNTFRDEISTMSLQPVPVPHHTYSKEFLPIIQLNLDFFSLKNICPYPIYYRPLRKVSLQLSYKTLLSPGSCSKVLCFGGTPNLDRVFQVESHKCKVERQNHLS